MNCINTSAPNLLCPKAVQGPLSLMAPPNSIIPSWRHCLAGLLTHKHHRPSKKLDHHFWGLFLIVERVSYHMFWLGLPLTLLHIHPVVHVSLLQPTSVNDIPNRVVNPPPPNEPDDSDEWDVNQRILDCRFDCHCKGLRLLYLIEWKGFDNTINKTNCELPEHLGNVPDLVQAFHQTYPDKPAP